MRETRRNEIFSLDEEKWQNCLYSQQIHVPKNRERRLAQVLTQLRHCHIKNFILGLSHLLENEKQPPDLICEKGVLKTFGKLAGKHPRQILFLIKLQDEALVRFFSVNF